MHDVNVSIRSLAKKIQKSMCKAAVCNFGAFIDFHSGQVRNELIITILIIESFH